MKRFALFTREVVCSVGHGVRITFSTIPAPIEGAVWWFEEETLYDAQVKTLVIMEALKTELEIKIDDETYPKFFLAEIDADIQHVSAHNAYRYILGDFHAVTNPINPI